MEESDEISFPLNKRLINYGDQNLLSGRISFAFCLGKTSIRALSPPPGWPGGELVTTVSRPTGLRESCRVRGDFQVALPY